MAKILLKAAVLFFIVLSIYLIVHPSACSNMIAGRERGVPVGVVIGTQHPMSEPAETVSSFTLEEDAAPAPAQQAVQGTDGAPAPTQPTYSQQDIDYAIASRYVELEREYARTHTLGKDSSREISFIVMDDFEMSPTEWEDFLSRATAADLFNKVRLEMPAQEPAAEPPAESH